MSYIAKYSKSRYLFVARVQLFIFKIFVKFLKSLNQICYNICILRERPKILRNRHIFLKFKIKKLINRLMIQEKGI